MLIRRCRVLWLSSVCHHSLGLVNPPMIFLLKWNSAISPRSALAQGDEHLPLEAIAVAIHGDARALLVVGEELPVAPGLVLVSDDVALEKTHLLSPIQHRHPPPPVFQLQH